MSWILVWNLFILLLSKYVLGILCVPGILLGAEDKAVSKNIQDFCLHRAFHLGNTDNQRIIYYSNPSGVRKGGTWHVRAYDRGFHFPEEAMS